MDIALTSIGVIHSPFTDPADAPIRSSRSTVVGSVEVFSQFAEGLRDLEKFSHIFLLYLIQCSQGYKLHVKPFLDDQEHHLLRVEGNRFDIEGIDMLDNTSLLDIKPYIPEFDIRENVQIGWYSRRANH
jgi:tRNA (Thr-GGU) A37 N-methylase